MSRSRRITTTGGGFSLILLLFILLSLVCFATLSIASARADEKLAEKYRDQNDSYYHALNEAHAWLEDLDRDLETLYRDGASEEAYFAAAGGKELTKRFSAGENFDLVLTLELLRPKTPEGPFYRLTGEKTESTVTYNYDNTLSVVK